MKKKELTTNQLIEAALELFAEHGIEKTTLVMIANKVGIAKPSIYYHFESKEALIDQIFEDTFRNYRFEAYFQMNELTEQNFGEKLYEGGLKMLPEYDEIHIRVLNEFITIALRNEKYLTQIKKVEQEFTNGFQALLEKGIELGWVSRQNLEAKASMLNMVIDGIQDKMLMEMPFQIGYELVWKEAINSVLTRKF